MNSTPVIHAEVSGHGNEGQLTKSSKYLNFGGVSAKKNAYTFLFQRGDRPLREKSHRIRYGKSFLTPADTRKTGPPPI